MPPSVDPVSFVFAAVGAVDAVAPAAAVFVAYACAFEGIDQPVRLAASLFIGAYFRAPQATADLECSIRTQARSDNVTIDLGRTSLPISVMPTSWPLWDDAILIGASGIMRSARLGVVLNATAALLAAFSVAGTETSLSSLASALASSAIVLDGARAVWESGALNYTQLLSISAAAAPAFTLTLSGASRVVLFAGLTARGAFSPVISINASLGGVPCNLSAVSDDGVWAVLDTPSAAALCGSTAGDCGYAALTLASSPTADALGATLTCPPMCPGAVAGKVVPIPSGDGFALGIDPQMSLGALPTRLPPIDTGVSSQDIYYTTACAQTGLYTDPVTGACTNASDPASYACAYGSGVGCEGCPEGALCPGGSRLWPRAGFWAPTETASAPAPCSPPDPEVKCSGWNITRGAVQCGLPYQANSPRCGVCAPGYYMPGDGSCAACPVIAGAWDRYRLVILLLCFVLAAALCVGALLVVLLKLYGGTLEGSARLLLDLVLWSIAALQTVSQAAPASADALPSFLATIFRGIAVLQLDGVLLPPACTGAYAFESQVGVCDIFVPRTPRSCHHSSLYFVSFLRSALWGLH